MLLLELIRRDPDRVRRAAELKGEGAPVDEILALDREWRAHLHAARVNREEMFGPIATVIKVKDYEEALATSNDTEFGLAAGVVTTSLKYASDFKKKAEAGLVMVNLPTAGVDYHVPFGGRKGSSYGPREQGSYAKEFFTVVKTAYTAP